MRSAEPMVRMESPRSVDQKSNRLRMPATRAQRSDQCNGSGLPYGAGALDAHRAGTTCGACLPRLAELTAETLWQTVYCLEVIDRARGSNRFVFEVPSYHGLGQIQPGQRLIVRATIGGVDVQRPYTLTSSVTEPPLL